MPFGRPAERRPEPQTVLRSAIATGLAVAIALLACRRGEIPSGRTQTPPKVAVSTNFIPAVPQIEIPFRERYPSLENRYRLRGVHFFQDEWPYTFWDSVRISKLDSDFREIRAHGFNTIVLFLGWGVFQTRMNPRTYDDAMFRKLDAVIEAARRNDLWVVLRVGTPEHVPADLPDGGPYRLPDLMFEPSQIDALADLFLEVSKRVRHHENVFGLFNSWEDFSQYLMTLYQDEAHRMEFENRRGLFRRYLRQNGTLDSWNAKWGTSYQSFDQIPLPAMNDPALADYVNMIGHYINGAILTKMRVAPGMGLGYELRLDKEPVTIKGVTTWHGYGASYQLPPQFTFIAAYYNPFWGAPNDGGFITPEFALQMTRQVQFEIDSNSRGLPTFFEQLNLADDTPRFTQTNSKLRYPGDEARAAGLIIPFLFRRSIGYSLWTYRDYVGNVVADPAFQERKSPWEVSGPVTYQSLELSEREIVLAPGARLFQKIFDEFNPGRFAKTPFRVEIDAFHEGAGSASLNVSVTSDDGREGKRSFVIEGTTPVRYTAVLDEIDPTADKVAIEVPRESTGKIHIRRVRVWNHLMATGVVDRDGRPRRSRVIAYASENRQWELVERGLALPADYPAILKSDFCTHCSGVFEDGWATSFAALPVYVPFESGSITAELYLPDSLAAAEGIEVRARWQDAPTATPDVVMRLKRGLNSVRIPVSRDSEPTLTGDRVLIIRSDRTVNAGNDTRALAFRFIQAGLLDLKELKLGTASEGDFVIPAPQLNGNRILLRGHTTGDAQFRVNANLRGHPGVKWNVSVPGAFEQEIPSWVEWTSGTPELYLRIEKIRGSGSLVIDGLESENERTPNRVFR